MCGLEGDDFEGVEDDDDAVEDDAVEDNARVIVRAHESAQQPKVAAQQPKVVQSSPQSDRVVELENLLEQKNVLVMSLELRVRNLLEEKMPESCRYAGVPFGMLTLDRDRCLGVGEDGTVREVEDGKQHLNCILSETRVDFEQECGSIISLGHEELEELMGVCYTPWLVFQR